MALGDDIENKRKRSNPGSREDTVAVLGARVNYLESELGILKGNIRDDAKVLNERIDSLEKQVTQNMVAIGKLGERLTFFQGLQAAFSTLAAAIAAVVSVNIRR